MADRFKVGDRVRIIKGRSSGREASILSSRHHCQDWHCQETGTIITAFVYCIDVEGLGHEAMTPEGMLWFSVPEDWLVPIYDGWDKTEWKDCYWKPKILEKV